MKRYRILYEAVLQGYFDVDAVDESDATNFVENMSVGQLWSGSEDCRESICVETIEEVLPEGIY